MQPPPPRVGAPAHRPPRSGTMCMCPGHWFPSAAPQLSTSFSLQSLLGCDQQLFLEMAVGHVEKMPVGFFAAAHFSWASL